MALATASVEIVADTSRFERGLRQQLRSSGVAAGKAYSQAFDKSASSAGAGAATKNLNVNAEASGRKSGESWTQGFRKAIGKGGVKGSGGGLMKGLMASLQSSLGRGLSLGALLGPAIAGLGSLATQAVAELSPLTGFLAALPAVATGAAAAIGTLVMAFNGFGDAVSAGWSGDIPKFTQALGELTPAAQNVAKAVVGLKPAFSGIQDIAQQAFFEPLIGSFERLQAAMAGGSEMTMGNQPAEGFQQMAGALGQAAAAMVNFASSASALKAFEALSAGVSGGIVASLPGVTAAFDGIASAIQATAPLLQQFGAWIGEISAKFGEWIGQAADSGALTQWIQGAAGTFQQVLTIVKDLTIGLGSLFAQINNASGDGGGFLATLQQWAAAFRGFAASTQGQQLGQAIAGWAQVTMTVLGWVIKALAATMIFVYQLGTAVGTVFGALGAAAAAVGAFFGSLIQGAMVANQTVLGFFMQLPVWIMQAVMAIAGFVGQILMGFAAAAGAVWNFMVGGVQAAFGLLGGILAGAIAGFWNFLTNVGITITQALGWIGRFPIMVGQFFAGAGMWLIEAGRNVINGLINGMKSMLSPVGATMSAIAGKIRGFLPFSPAKEGPLSGSGNPEASGRKIGAMLATGIASQRGTVASAMRDITSLAPTMAPASGGSPFAPVGTATLPPAGAGGFAGAGAGVGRGNVVDNSRTTTVGPPTINVQSPSADPARVARRTANRLAAMTTA